MHPIKTPALIERIDHSEIMKTSLEHWKILVKSFGEKNYTCFGNRSAASSLIMKNSTFDGPFRKRIGVRPRYNSR